ncbi:MULTISPECIES: hypothetical protein [Paraburkholderia]|uniref:hypothetical protein n=1 Tax=Paraburkholderia TaxID=1822464 RepID=UPI001FE72FB4|nr:hypothetical protein [Paraburkholderia podalyriae]
METFEAQFVNHEAGHDLRGIDALPERALAVQDAGLTDKEREHPHASTLQFVLHIAQPFVVLKFQALRLVNEYDQLVARGTLSTGRTGARLRPP